MAFLATDSAAALHDPLLEALSIASILGGVGRSLPFVTPFSLPFALVLTCRPGQGYGFLEDAELLQLQGSTILQLNIFCKFLSLARIGMVVYWHRSPGYLATSAESNTAGSIDSPTVLSRAVHI